jgi:hypothetical protein
MHLEEEKRVTLQDIFSHGDCGIFWNSVEAIQIIVSSTTKGKQNNTAAISGFHLISVHLYLLSVPAFFNKRIAVKRLPTHN